jgi:uncharacterized protein (TIGR00288 family)
MTPRNNRPVSSPRPAAVPIHRGPQAMSPVAASPYTPAPFHTAPNAALLIDFDNVTMGIRSDLGHELRSLLSSSIIKGKVAVQRAYADWRRYPQYVVPLAESSIDMIMAPAYGSSKKNATDIRLAIDAMELVFNRPEIGTYILLSGDSDFSSLVMKLKEYGKYVIGVGIRESSSDLLVQNCDEYYSYNALAGLVKTNEEENVKHDPWELVVEAAARMKRNGDVMRSDRLKQVMQEIDSTFDEKDLGMAKFSRFAQEAAQRGLIRVTKLENGQMEVDVAGDGKAVASGAASASSEATTRPTLERGGESSEESAARRSRRGRGGRGRGRDREPRAAENGAAATPAEGAAHFSPSLEAPVTAPPAERAPTPAARSAAEPEMVGERLTRDEALTLLKKAVSSLTTSVDKPVPASAVRRKARELLGRDSETLDERFFLRILRDAHDADVIDLRKRGDDFEVAPAAAVASVSEQLAAAAPVAAEPSQSARSAANAASLRRGMRGRGRGGEMPPELMNFGVIGGNTPAAETGAPAAGLSLVVESEPEEKSAKPAKRGRAPAAKSARAKKAAPAAAGEKAAPKAKRPRAKKTATEA